MRVGWRERRRGREGETERGKERREGIVSRQHEGHHDFTEPERILTAD